MIRYDITRRLLAKSIAPSPIGDLSEPFLPKSDAADVGEIKENDESDKDPSSSICSCHYCSRTIGWCRVRMRNNLPSICVYVVSDHLSPGISCFYVFRIAASAAAMVSPAAGMVAVYIGVWLCWV